MVSFEKFFLMFAVAVSSVFPCYAADTGTRLDVQANLSGLRQNMDDQCVSEEASMLGLSIPQCIEQKRKAISKCTSIAGEGLTTSITFDEFEQVLFPRVSYCMLLERSGLSYTNESGDKFRALIQFQKQLAAGLLKGANPPLQRDAPQAARP
jgi:hypothetical protein